jgi:hypothetical protein
MKTYSHDQFEFRSRLTQGEVIDRLHKRTLSKKILGMVLTNKDFIGRVNTESFTVIDSSYPIPYGAACILSGAISPASELVITTTLHKAFRIMWLICVILLVGVLTISSVVQSGDFATLLVSLVLMVIAVAVLRLFLHYMYVLARNRAIEKMKTILEVVE